MIEEIDLYGFDDVTVDCQNFRVTKQGQEKTLSPRAFDVLTYLIKNSGRVVEKRELLEEVWKEVFVTDNALTRVIKEIRQTLGDKAEKPLYIETINKRGYRFIAQLENSSLLASSSEASEKIWPWLLKLKRFAISAFAIAVGIMILIIGSIVLSEYISEIRAADTRIDSIAVLPFKFEPGSENLEDKFEHFEENLTNSLSQISNLRVLPSNIGENYQDKDEDPQILGRVLRVRAVLTGKITRRGNILNVQVSLIDSLRKDQLWGQQFTHSIGETAELQKEVSAAVVSFLSKESNN